MLLSFGESGYLPTRETLLEFDDETDSIPPDLRLVSTRISS